jgi:hypothetical protein
MSLPSIAAADFDLPVFEEPQIEWWPRQIAWEDAMRMMAPFRDYYMAHYDSPEKRLADKNPEPFVLD